MKTLVRLKKLLTLAGAALFASAASAVTITIDRVQQRYPWNNLVDIDYTLDGDVADSAIFSVTATIDGTEYKASTFKQVFGKTAGSHRVTWDTDRDGVKAFSKNATFALGITIEKPAGYDTVIFDLDAGTYQKLTLGSDNYASINTDEYKTNKLAMRVIPAQTYTYVATNGWFSNGVRQVTVSSFLMGVFEVTQAQYARVMGTMYNDDETLWPSYWTNATYRATRPVDQVSYEMWRGKRSEGFAYLTNGNAVDPTKFMGLLRAKFGGKIDFDLPKDCQWSAAAQAGYTSVYGHLGGFESYDTAITKFRCKENSSVSITSRDAYADRNAIADYGTAPVGSYESNPYGLYDCIGNVVELCVDGLIPSTENNALVNPTGSSTGNIIARGGAAGIQSYQMKNSSGRLAGCTSVTSIGHIYTDAITWGNLNANHMPIGARLAAPLVD